ncbi:MAG TPA: serine hydrolase [Thermoanaerobaculia bacterium]|nr:serine hydrolase [Thermoanaerobaculia bacterium]
MLLRPARPFRSGLACGLALLGLCALAPPRQEGRRDLGPAVVGKGRQIDDVLRRFAAFGFSGTVLVGERGTVLLHKGYGLADRQRGIPNTTAGVFPFASITKVFTAAAIYKLEAEGKLSTADPIGKYLPYVPTAAQRITVLQLLTHSSGIPHEADNVARGATPGELVTAIFRVPLQSEPGARYSYSNAGYDLLTIIVEQVSGETFESYVRGNLLRPAGLLHTGWRSDFQSRLFPRGYQDMYRDETSEVTFPPLATGFLVGTAADLYRWSEVLYTDRVLPPTARTKLFTPAFDEHVNGWLVTKTKGGVEVQTTDGGYPGYEATMARFPSRFLTIVLVMNSDAGWPKPVYNTLRGILLGEEYEPPPLVQAIDEVRLERLSGRYELPFGATLEARTADGSLLVDAAGQEAVSALAGADAATNLELIGRNDVATEFVEHLKRGDFDWARSITEFQAPEPFQRLRNFWHTMTTKKGALKSFRVVGSSPTRGRGIQTFIRFDLERGSEYWMLHWWEGKMRGWAIDVSAPTPPRFLPISADEFASLDVPTSRVTRMRFHREEGELAIPTASGGQVLARKVN